MNIYNNITIKIVNERDQNMDKKILLKKKELKANETLIQQLKIVMKLF